MTLSRFVLLFLLALLVSFSGNTAAADCVAYREYMHLLGTLSSGASPGWQVAVSGSMAYVGGYELLVIDVSNPNSPVLVTRFSDLNPTHEYLNPYVTGMAASGSLLCAMVHKSSGATMHVFDVSNPAVPVRVAFGPSGVDVTLSGTTAYVSSGTTGFEIVDLTNPSAPQILAAVDTPGDAQGIAVSGTLACVADGSSGLQVFDVSNPHNPILLGHAATTQKALKVAMIGSMAYVNEDSARVEVIDLSNPTAPVIVGHVLVHGLLTGVVARGVQVYVSIHAIEHWRGGVEAIDVSDPGAPTIIGSQSTQGFANDIALSEGRVYVPGGFGNWLSIVEIAGGASVTVVGWYASPAWGEGVAVDGPVAYLADTDSGLVTINVSDPSSPVPIGQVDTPGYALKLAVQDGMAYVADLTGLQLIDVSDPSHPHLEGNLPGAARDVAVSGSFAYVSGSSYGFGVVDVSNPSAPSLIGSLSCCEVSQARGIAQSGSLVYLCADTSGLKIIDVSNPTDPKIIGRAHMPYGAEGVAISGAFAYVADPVDGLEVVDISNPESPIIVGSVRTPDQCVRVTVTGTIAYVVCPYAGITLIDVSDPSHPLIVGGLDVSLKGEGDPSKPRRPWHALVAGPYLYVADDIGLIIAPTECGAPTPVRLSSFDAIPRKDGILLTWSVIDDVSGFHVDRSEEFDGVYERLTQTLLHFDGIHHYLDNTVRPGTTYLYRLEALNRGGGTELIGPVTATAGLFLEQTPRLGPAFPNPFANSSTIPFTLSRSGDLRLRILDLKGREIRTFEQQRMETGDHSFTWDGRDDKGNLLPAGIYFYELRAPGFGATRKLIRLRPS